MMQLSFLHGGWMTLIVVGFLSGCVLHGQADIEGPALKCQQPAAPLSLQPEIIDRASSPSRHEIRDTRYETRDTPVPSPAEGRIEGSHWPVWMQSARTDFGELPDRILSESAHTFLRRDNMTLLLLAGAASVVMHNTNADDNIQDTVHHNPTFRGFWDEAFNIAGSPASHFPATGLWYAVAAQRQDEFNKQRAWTMMTALSVNGLVTIGLKAIRDNDCPNREGWAWPSGHTSSSFTVASVLDEFYGRRVGIPAYILAGLVGYRMVDTRDHWASDVVFGATLGCIVGHSVAGRHKDPELAGFKILPYSSYTGDSVIGVSLLRQF